MPGPEPARSCCPTCRRVLPAPTPVRHLLCWSCGKPFEQAGQGRRRLVCSDPRCTRKRINFRRRGGTVQ